MRFLSSLYGRVTLLTVAAGILLGGAAILGMDMTARLYHQEANQRLHGDLASWLVKQYRFERDGRVDTAGIDAIFGDAMRINPSIEVYLLDTDGRILAFNAPPGRVRLDRVDMAPVRKFLAGDSHLPIMGTDPRQPMGRTSLLGRADSRRVSAIVGYVYVVVGGELYQTWVTRRSFQSDIEDGQPSGRARSRSRLLWRVFELQISDQANHTSCQCPRAILGKRFPSAARRARAFRAYWRRRN